MTHQNSKFAKTRESEASVSQMKNALHYGVALPLAAVVTIGLTLSMAGLIATEFTPQDKSETASFEINPRVEDIPDVVRLEKPDPLKTVETPPPPPTVATYETAEVKLPHREVTGKKTEFKMEKLVFGNDIPITIDTPPTPHVRVPPVFPARFLQGDVSGYCRVRFDISVEGLPFNVATTECTSGQLESATVKSVQKWKYAPQMKDGRPVSRSGLETTIRFDLKDDRGELLPLPRGY